jgi:ferredoxin
MNITSVKSIYFSPNGTTKRVVEAIADTIQVESSNRIDMTSPETETRNFGELKDEMVIIGTPVYSYRVPSIATSRLRRLKANNTPAVVVVVYGDVAYMDALLELHDIAAETGCKPVAAGVFIGEHSLLPFASGRPDTEDLKKAEDFGKKIRDKLDGIKTLDDIPPIQVPGIRPYRNMESTPQEFIQTYPLTRETLCIKCGTCVSVCPAGAITINDTVQTEQEACILCCACVKNCPAQARVMDSPHYREILESMKKKVPERKEPETFL